MIGFGFYRNELHMGPSDGLANGCSVCGIILCGAPHERLNVRRRDQFDFVAKLGQFASPVVGGSASFHTNKAWPCILEELYHLASPKRGGSNHRTRGIHRMDLKVMLGQIKPDWTATRRAPE